MNKKIVIIATIMLALAIILGAFGAHGLKSLVSAEKVASFEVGVRYQIYVGLILFVLGLNTEKFKFSLTWVTRLLIQLAAQGWRPLSLSASNASRL